MDFQVIIVRILQKIAILFFLIVISLFSYALTILFNCPYIYLTLPTLVVMGNRVSSLTIVVVSILDEQLLNFPSGLLIAINTLIVFIYRYGMWATKREQAQKQRFYRF